MVQLLLILILLAVVLNFFFSLKLYYLIKEIVFRVEGLESDFLKSENRVESVERRILNLEEHLKLMQNQYLKGDR